MTQGLGSIPDCPEWSIELHEGPPRNVCILSDRRASPMGPPVIGRGPEPEIAARVGFWGDEVVVWMHRVIFRPAELDTLPRAICVAIEVLKRA